MQAAMISENDSDMNKGGCGATEFCSTCGAAKAILGAQRGETGEKEWLVTRKDGLAALDLRGKSSPLEVRGERFTFLAITDISDEKRRIALERIFFHDILNEAGNIRGLFEIIRFERPEMIDEYSEMLDKTINVLIDEIIAQKDLVAAESDTLTVKPGLVNSIELLREIIGVYKFHQVATKRHIQLNDDAEEIAFTTDRSLLSRVLGNMVKNALEASKPGETVTLGCRSPGDEVEIWVHNPGVMPREVQLQLFKRSFSTKSGSRGLGTYSMKLLTEQYLGGRVTFSSSQKTGVRFSAVYPLNPPPEKKERGEPV